MLKDCIHIQKVRVLIQGHMRQKKWARSSSADSCAHPDKGLVERSVSLWGRVSVLSIMNSEVINNKIQTNEQKSINVIWWLHIERLQNGQDCQPPTRKTWKKLEQSPIVAHSFFNINIRFLLSKKNRLSFCRNRLHSLRWSSISQIKSFINNSANWWKNEQTAE
jgi:hypothetical protein